MWGILYALTKTCSGFDFGVHSYGGLYSRGREEVVRCWNCKESVDGPVCVSCGVIQPLGPSPDLFEVLGVVRSYFVTNEAISVAYRTLTRAVHPDRFAGRSAVERRMSLQWAASANQARLVLLDPLRRARYLATGRADPPESGGPTLDSEFLEDVFEMQMKLESDSAEVYDWAKNHKAMLIEELQETFRVWEAGAGDLDIVEERLARLKYVNNILDSAAELCS